MSRCTSASSLIQIHQHGSSFLPTSETLWQRFTMYEDGREPIMSMAYACLTLFERSVLEKRVRRAAATQYAVDQAILSRLGHWRRRERRTHRSSQTDIRRVDDPTCAGRKAMD